MRDKFYKAIGKLMNTIALMETSAFAEDGHIKALGEARQGLWEYFNAAQAEMEKLQGSEAELYSNYSALMARFTKRGIMIQMHG